MSITEVLEIFHESIREAGRNINVGHSIEQEIKDTEKSIPNFVVHREDRCGDVKGGG